MPDTPVDIQLDILTPARDGVLLHGVLYRPARKGRFPTLLIRSPYSTQHPRYVAWAQDFVKAGYAVLQQDCRGRYESDGNWRPYIDETNDGYDTHQWIGQQPWSDGNIGTFGVSYPGFTQLLPAHLQSKHLKAMVPIANQEDNYGHLRYNGVLQLQNAMNFMFLGRRMLQAEHANLMDMDAIHRRLPLVTALDDVADRPFYREIIRHTTFDDFWSAYSMKFRYHDVEAPALFITGWYDNLVHEGFKCFKGLTTKSMSPEVRAQSKIIIGPWSHKSIGSEEAIGDIAYGINARVDIPGEHIRWYDRRLKGIENGIDDEPPVRIFVMGENAWRSENEWPLARTQYAHFYLHSRGRANSLHGDGGLSRQAPQDEPPDEFTYDPIDPVPTYGGQSMFPENTGPRERRSIERRDDVLVYTSKPLEQDTEVTGPIVLKLFAASNAPDTDFTAALVDVHPRGQAIIICDGIIRARFRDSFEQPTLIEPDTIYKYHLVLWETSNLFLEGHRIRLEVSSSNFPRFDRNLNSGNDPATDTEICTAKQTVFHNSEHPSHLVLPIIPK
ncbi:MAG: CocE/NonD family hydrolase [Planctomycetota bacterium]|nr:CocE/NonD family hydrolase [Planctomycetota bacterium]